ncbi:HD domain-containing protein [Streptomyces sp. NPDC041068]|uniref:HD domain-containing protein n=1 Tax=Streptomyces sp. NPDC041068 TaxID=3155130 RepID=UPI0033E0990F
MKPETPTAHAYKWCWGTSDLADLSVQQGGAAWNPLVCELVGSSAVMLELWDRVLRDQQRGDLAEGFGLQDGQSARLLSAFLAGVSRLGNASPAHMDSLGRGECHSPAVEEAHKIWRQQASEVGLPLPSTPGRVRHANLEHITAAVLPRLMGCDCAGFVDGEQCRNRAHRGLYVVAYALNRHGGDILHADTVAKAYRATGGTAWDAVRGDLVKAVAQYVGVNPWSLPEMTQQARPTALSGLSRLVAQSNKLSLGNASAGYSSPLDSYEVWSDRARLQASEAVSQVRVSG